jgi:diphthine synthase
MLYLIGLGLNFDGISKYGLDIVKKCKKIYLESYTVDFPYTINDLENVIGKKIYPANRDFIESLKIVDESRKKDVALLVYGSPLTATTHITIIEEARKSELRVKVIHNASVLDAVSETGLQLYKFGKITSMPNFEADSFLETIKENRSIDAHTLILIDIGMEFGGALKKMEKAVEEKEKIVVCSRLGARGRKIIYGTIKELENKKIKKPFCFVIPGKLHFMEKEVLERYNVRL